MSEKNTQAEAPHNLVSDREYLRLFNEARHGSVSPTGLLRGIRACISAYEEARPTQAEAPSEREAFELYVNEGGKFPGCSHRDENGNYTNPFTQPARRAWLAALRYAALATQQAGQGEAVEWPDYIRPPFNMMSGRTLIHIETDTDNPIGAGIHLCSMPKDYEKAAAAIVAACNATPPAPQQPEALAQQERDRGDAPCPDGLLPDGEICPRCGGKRGPSGIDGGSWVHIRAARSSEGGQQ